MAGLDKEVQDEIDNFKKNCLDCKRDKDCLPLYFIREKSSWQPFSKKQVTDTISKGLSLHQELDDEQKRDIFDHIYSVANVYMKDFIYPGEKEIKPDCENYNCPVHCVVKALGNGHDYMNYQWAAIATYKYKVSESEHCDIGMQNALERWIKVKLNVNGKETTLAAEYEKSYKKLEEDTIKKVHH